MSKVIRVSIPPNLIQELQEVLESPEGFYQKKYPEDVSPEFRATFESIVKENNPAIKKIGSGWINATRKIEGTLNGYGWHNEDEERLNLPLNDFMVFWVSGDTNAGGEFKYIEDDGNIETVPFEPTSFLTMSKDTLHSVEHYDGKSPRISINLNIELH